jgi:hypothetical protein
MAAVPCTTCAPLGFASAGAVPKQELTAAAASVRPIRTVLLPLPIMPACVMASTLAAAEFVATPRRQRLAAHRD